MLHFGGSAFQRGGLITKLLFGALNYQLLCGFQLQNISPDITSGILVLFFNTQIGSFSGRYMTGEYEKHMHLSLL